MSVTEQVAELVERRNVIWHFVLSELKSEHRDKLLGNLWHLIDPLAFMLVYYAVWAVILGRRGPDFMAYLFVGIICYQFYQSSVVRAAQILRSHVGLIRGVYFPKAALPTAVVLSQLYGFLCGLAVLGLLMVFFLINQARMPPEQLAEVHHPLSVGLNLLWLPLVTGIECLFCLGSSYLFAIAGVWFRDMPNVMAFVLRLSFYLSPIFYYPEDLPERFRVFYLANPFSHFFGIMRGALIYNRPPSLEGMLYLTGISLAVLVIGLAVFFRREGTVVKHL